MPAAAAHCAQSGVAAARSETTSRLAYSCELAAGGYLAMLGAQPSRLLISQDEDNEVGNENEQEHSEPPQDVPVVRLWAGMCTVVAAAGMLHQHCFSCATNAVLRVVYQNLLWQNPSSWALNNNTGCGWASCISMSALQVVGERRKTGQLLRLAVLCCMLKQHGVAACARTSPAHETPAPQQSQALAPCA